MRIFLISFALLLTLSFAQGESFISPSKRAAFKPQEIPEFWIPASFPQEGNAMKAFLALNESKEFRPDGHLVSRLIQLCGKPSTYMVAKSPKKGTWNYLVYDLPSGETIIVYVSEPPAKSFGAAAAYDSKGKLLRLIK